MGFGCEESLRFVCEADEKEDRKKTGTEEIARHIYGVNVARRYSSVGRVMKSAFYDTRPSATCRILWQE